MIKIFRFNTYLNEYVGNNHVNGALSIGTRSEILNKSTKNVDLLKIP